MAEREVLLDAVRVRLVNERGAPEAATALRPFGLAEVATTGAGAQNLAARGNFEALRDRVLGFDAFGTTHKFNFLPKRARNISTRRARASGNFSPARLISNALPSNWSDERGFFGFVPGALRVGSVKPVEAN